MIDTSVRAAFENMAISGKGDASALAAGLRRNVTGVGLRALAAKLVHVAVCAPARLIDVYDGAAHGWLSGILYPPGTRNTKNDRPPEAFWEAFWQVLEQPAADRRRGAFTLATARLAGLLDPQINARVAATTADFRGVREAAARGLLERIDVRDLAGMPPSTLGGVVHREAMVRGQLGRILDPAALSLDTLPAPLGYLNARILESHLVWATVAGYSHAELDELALAAFQMAQFGHHYSSLLLALTMTTIAMERPEGLEIVLESIFRGWLHGRETRPLLGVAWSELWDLPIDAVRQSLGVTPFPSPLTAAVWQTSRTRGSS